MKKSLLILTLLLISGSMAFSQGRIATHKNAYIWGHSNRNTGTKGSAISLTNGMTYSLLNVTKQSSPRQIDMLCFFGRVNRVQGFHLFAPGNPFLDIDWDRQSGTRPYSSFEGPSSAPQGPAWLKNWNVRNATKLQKVDDIDFDSLNAASFAQMQVDENYIVSGVQEGDVIIFETASGKKGAFRIEGISDDPDRADKAGEGAYQKLTLTIKVQR
jgi:hypothetical protein